MKITVKTVKVLSKGTNEYGDWKLVKVTTDDEEYTTLAKEAETLTLGTIINITDMDEDEKGKKFKKYEVLEKVSSASPSTNGKPEMTNEMWDEKAKIERDSIESQTRAERITELWIAGKIPDDDSLVTKLQGWLNKLGSPGKEAESSTAEPKEKAPQDNIKAAPKKTETQEAKQAPPSLKTLGDLYTKGAQFGLNPEAICQAVGVEEGSLIIDYDEAWKATAIKYANTIKAAQEAGKKHEEDNIY